MPATLWKNAGYSYLRYLDLCSRALRSCLKPELAATAVKRGESILKYAIWDNGKQGELKHAENTFRTKLPQADESKKA